MTVDTDTVAFLMRNLEENWTLARQAEDKRATEVQLKQNGFWASYLIRASQNGENPDLVLNHMKDLDQITVQSTKDAANKYLGGNNLIKLILYPEKK